MVSRKVPPLHPPPVVYDDQRRFGRIRSEPNARGSRIERVGGYLGQDGLLERARIGVAQVFEQVLEIDSSLPHREIL